MGGPNWQDERKAFSFWCCLPFDCISAGKTADWSIAGKAAGRTSILDTMSLKTNAVARSPNPVQKLAINASQEPGNIEDTGKAAIKPDSKHSPKLESVSLDHNKAVERENNHAR